MSVDTQAEVATATDVRRWVAGRLGMRPQAVVVDRAVADNYNRHHPHRPYTGPVKTENYRLPRSYS